ncbi:MAG: metallophosphoesterase, partial [Bacteroidota bacterium]
MRKIFVITFLFVNFISFSKIRFVRVVFNSVASEEATIIWEQHGGKFINLIYSENNFSAETNSGKTIVDKVSSKNKAREMVNYIVRLKRLKSNTKYYFQIEDTDGKTIVYYFSSCSNSPNDRISFIGGGDSRDRSEIRRKANVLVAKLKAHAVLFNGDFTGFDIHSQWIEWFTDWEYSIAQDGRITPLVVTRGNHERSNSVLVKLFDVPSKGVYYSTEFGGDLLNLVSLNSEILKIGAQK